MFKEDCNDWTHFQNQRATESVCYVLWWGNMWLSSFNPIAACVQRSTLAMCIVKLKVCTSFMSTQVVEYRIRIMTGSSRLKTTSNIFQKKKLGRVDAVNLQHQTCCCSEWIWEWETHSHVPDPWGWELLPLLSCANRATQFQGCRVHHFVRRVVLSPPQPPAAAEPACRFKVNTTAAWRTLWGADWSVKPMWQVGPGEAQTNTNTLPTLRANREPSRVAATRVKHRLRHQVSD